MGLFFQNLKYRAFAFFLFPFVILFQVSCGFLQDRSSIRQSVQKKEKSDFYNSLENQNETVKGLYHGNQNHIPYHFNKRVQAWLKYYQGRGRGLMTRYLIRSSRYLPLIKRELRKANLPDDLAYIVFVESGFNSRAHSRANAVGYWQFIKETGRNYGLKINGYIDERRDIILSTRAAIRYFKALYALFDDWFLAMAAYNTGENRVKRLVMRYKTRDYWELVYRRKLLRETRNYVPKFLAIRLIAKNPGKFGFYNLAFESELNYKTYRVTQPLSFKKLAKELGSQSYYRELRRLNPKFKTPYILPYYHKGGVQTVLRLPLEAPDLTREILEKSLAKGPFRPVSEYAYYRIRRGDSLSRIAERFRVSYRSLIRVNGIRRPSYIRVGQVIKIPKRYRSLYRPKRKWSQRKKRLSLVGSFKNKNVQIHTVKKGESLTLIAEKYQVPLRKLAKANSIRNLSSIYPGEKLVIPD